MATLIAKRLIELLQTEAPEIVFHRGDGGTRLGSELFLQAPNSAVGELHITDEGDELTAFIGGMHGHWGCYEQGLSEAERREHIAREMLQFIRDVVSDRIEFYGSKASGGLRKVGSKPRSFLSKLLHGRQTHTWSGPVRMRV